MKKTHRKLVMAAIILSCGLAMHADPSAKRSRVQRHGTTGAAHWQVLPPVAQARPTQALQSLRPPR